MQTVTRETLDGAALVAALAPLDPAATFTVTTDDDGAPTVTMDVADGEVVVATTAAPPPRRSILGTVQPWPSVRVTYAGRSSEPWRVSPDAAPASVMRQVALVLGLPTCVVCGGPLPPVPPSERVCSQACVDRREARIREAREVRSHRSRWE